MLRSSRFGGILLLCAILFCWESHSFGQTGASVGNLSGVGQVGAVSGSLSGIGAFAADGGGSPGSGMSGGEMSAPSMDAGNLGAAAVREGAAPARKDDESLPAAARIHPGAEETVFGGTEADDGQIHKATVGKVDLNLKRFGMEFFRRAAAFRPDPSALVGPDYVLGPGDTLKIDVWGNIEGSYMVTVDRNGEIVLPKVGVVSLWNQTFAEARKTIRRQVSKYFTSFEMNVTMGGLRSIQVYLVGELNNPGTYVVSSLSTALTALSAAGGPSPRGTLRNVQVLREGKVAATIDFYDFFLSGDKSSDVRLQSGDTLFVPMAGPLVGVAGNVRRPAVYELKDAETLGQVLDLAGGVVPSAYLQKVQVDRVEAHRQKIVLDLDLAPTQEGDSQAWDTVLQDRDLVKVYPIAVTGGYVTLSGYVAYPGRYQLTEGMHLADLIVPYGNLLPEFYPNLARIIRVQPPEYRPEALTVDLNKALQGDPEHNIALQEYDEVVLYSRDQMEEQAQVTVSGAVLNPGTYRLFQKMTVKDLVAAAGNLSRRAYLGEAEISRVIPSGKETKTERYLIDLEKALQGDPRHNLALQVDDHLFVRAIPDFGDQLTVTIRGEVLFPGQYVISKGERLSSLLKRAGGYTDEAYLRGAAFTRESAKEQQRQRMKKLIFEQEQEIARLNADMAEGAMSEEDLAASQTILESRRQVLDKLKKAPITGRMVVHLAPLESFSGSAQDIVLMDGDALTIPRSTQAVTVLGEVYNPTSLTYRPGAVVANYLAQVGGVTKDADKKEIYVVRADGTVFSKRQAGMGMKWDGENFRWIVGGFDTTELYPGDAILVPEKVEKIAVMKEVKDLTTILYQMALGAAAVASF